MSLTAWNMYWLLKLDSFCSFFFAFGVIGSVGSLIVAFICLIESVKDWFKKLIIPLSIGLCCLFIATLLPTTKQMAAIIVVPKIANNERLQEVPEKVLDLGLEWLEELRPVKKEESTK